jgi:hypothetical protein
MEDPAATIADRVFVNGNIYTIYGERNLAANN